MKRKEVQVELDAIARKHHGLLRPPDVVEYAKNKNTALHKCFCWDDTEAARKYRLQQAREVIEVCVTIIGDNPEPVRVYVSMADDRNKPGGGYRSLEVVMEDDELRGNLLQQALREFQRLQTKYQSLKALVPVFQALKKVKSGQRPAA